MRSRIRSWVSGRAGSTPCCSRAIAVASTGRSRSADSGHRRPRAAAGPAGSAAARPGCRPHAPRPSCVCPPPTRSRAAVRVCRPRHCRTLRQSRSLVLSGRRTSRTRGLDQRRVQRDRQRGHLPHQVVGPVAGTGRVRPCRAGRRSGRSGRTPGRRPSRNARRCRGSRPTRPAPGALPAMTTASSSKKPPGPVAITPGLSTSSASRSSSSTGPRQQVRRGSAGPRVRGRLSPAAAGAGTRPTSAPAAARPYGDPPRRQLAVGQRVQLLLDHLQRQVVVALGGQDEPQPRAVVRP